MSEAARKAEVAGEPGKVEFRGHTFEVPLDYDDLSIDFTEALEDGRSVGVVRGALGPAQWRVVKAMNLKNRDLGELSDAIAEAMGFTDSGNSPASSD